MFETAFHYLVVPVKIGHPVLGEMVWYHTDRKWRVWYPWFGNGTVLPWASKDHQSWCEPFTDSLIPSPRCTSKGRPAPSIADSLIPAPGMQGLGLGGARRLSCLVMPTTLFTSAPSYTTIHWCNVESGPAASFWDRCRCSRWGPGPGFQVPSDSSLLCWPDDSPHSSVCTITWNLNSSPLGKRVSNDARKQGGRQVLRSTRTLAPGETVSCARTSNYSVCKVHLRQGHLGWITPQHSLPVNTFIICHGRCCPVYLESTNPPF